MSKFCTNALLEGGKSGEYGDCGLFIVNGFGFVAIFAVLIIMPMLIAKKNKRSAVLSSHHDSNHDLKAFAMSSNYKRKLMVVKVMHYMMVVLAACVFVFSVLEEVSGHDYVVNYLSVCLRVVGWVILSFNVQELIVRRNRLLMCALCWGTSQVATAGMSSIHYQLDSDNLLLSVCTVLYFVATCLYVVAIVFQIIHKTERYELSNLLLYCGDSSSKDAASNDREVDREAMSSLYIKQQGKKRVSYDAPSASHMLHDDTDSITSSMFGSSQHPQQGPPSLPAFSSAPPPRPASLRSVDLTSEKTCSPARPLSSSRVTSKWSSLRGQFRSGFGNEVTLRVQDWECFVLNEKNRIALYRLELQEARHAPVAGDAPATSCVLVTKRHDELLFLHEKLAGCFPNIYLPKVPVPPLLFSQEVQRGGEHEESGQSNVELTKLLYGNIAYSLHLQEMNSFLSALLAHDVVGQKTYAELRSVDLAPSSLSNRFLDTRFASSPASKIVNLRESQVSIDDSSWEDQNPSLVAASPAASSMLAGRGAAALSSASAGYLCLEVPPFGHLQSPAGHRAGACSVRVTGVVEGEMLKGSADKLFFLLEVCCSLPASCPSPAPSPVAEGSSPPAAAAAAGGRLSQARPDVQRRTVKKKFKQLLTFNNILLKSHVSSIADIAKNDFPKLSRVIDGEEHRLSKSELVRELDRYVSAVYTARNPHVALLLSFVETDIHDCTGGFDMVFSASVAGRASIPEGGGGAVTSASILPLPCILRTVDSDTKSFKLRMKHSNLRNKLFATSDGKILPENVPALNSMGANWVEEMLKANEILDTLASTSAADKARSRDSKRLSVTRDSSSSGGQDVGVSVSGFMASSSISGIVSDSLAKLTLLVQHAGGAADSVQPYQDPDPTEYLQFREVGILNWRSTAHTSELAGAPSPRDDSQEGEVAAGTEEAYSHSLCGVWLSQWRLRRAVACTTAFAEICVEVSNLKSLPVKQLKKAGEADKLAFLINLYNLISLHASVLMPWPHVDDLQGRCRWQAQARYQVGDLQLSLLQIEYALLRTRLVSRPPPTIPQCFSFSVPSPADIKHLSSLLPKTVDVRALMALALPFRSSPPCYVYLSSVNEQLDGSDNTGALQRELFHLVSELLVSRIRCYSVESKVVVPKVLRRYLEDILLFRKSYGKVSTDPSPQLQLDDNGAGLVERSSLISSSRGENDSVAARSSQRLSSSLPDERGGSGSGGRSSSTAAHVSVRGLSVDINQALRVLKESLSPPPVLGKTELSTDLDEGGVPTRSRDERTGDDLLATHAGDWERAAGLESTSPQARSSMLHRYSKPCFGDKIIAESEFQQLRQILATEVKIKNRTYHLKTYPDCFLGTDAVACLSNYIPGGSQSEAIAVGNNLIEFGVMRHVLGEHWLKPKDLFYSLGGTSASGRQMTPLLSFIMHHISEHSYSLLHHQLSSSDDLSFSVLYLPEDFRFKVPLKIAK